MQLLWHIKLDEIVADFLVSGFFVAITADTSSIE